MHMAAQIAIVPDAIAIFYTPRPTTAASSFHDLFGRRPRAGRSYRMTTTQI